MFETHRNVYNCTKMIQKKYKWWWRKVQPKSPSENQYNLSWFLGNPGILLSSLSWPAICALRCQRLLDLNEFNQISIGSNFFVFQFYFNSLKPGINHGWNVHFRIVLFDFFIFDIYAETPRIFFTFDQFLVSFWTFWK